MEKSWDKKIRVSEAREMASTCLLHSHVDLGSNPWTSYQRLGVVTCVCNSSGLGLGLRYRDEDLTGA